VGHSYGGPVITEAANKAKNVKALVYVAAFSPDAGESSLSLSSMLPGSTLGEALMPVTLPDGGIDLYIRPENFHTQFAADVPASVAELMAATQRPVTQAALAELSGKASWQTIPSYAIYGSADRIIPPAIMKLMAERARSVKTIVIDGASHALMVSHPGEVAARSPLSPPKSTASSSRCGTKAAKARKSARRGRSPDCSRYLPIDRSAISCSASSRVSPTSICS
jgi:pimeloyl-ACP methyl ester carboxylesterase